MNRQMFMSVAAGLSIISGLAALLVPAQTAAVFGLDLNEVGLSQTRMLGAAYLGYASLIWFARSTLDETAQRAIALGNAVSWGLSVVVTVAGLMGGLAGTQTWLLVVVEVVFTAAWGYFAFIDRAQVAPT